MSRRPRNPQPLDAPAPRRRRMSRRKRLLVTISVALTALLVAAGAAAAFVLRSLNEGIVRSDFALPHTTKKPEPGEQNILIMGMDTRVDQRGKPLPKQVYEALHAGTEDDGGYNANVLMLIHIPKDRKKSVGISIPRDDYAEIVGAPLGVTHSKIKEAYGLAMQQRMNELQGDEKLSPDEKYQQARAAGRQAQIETVSHFLGDVRIDHFVEMTMGGFYYVSEAVAPITVCLNRATEDSYSGARFAAGVQELDAQQAMSFVRQRRDTGVDGPELTDLDRARRQQAFLVALADKLKQQSTLTDPKTVTELVGVTQSHVALDTGFDVLGFLDIARTAAQNGIEFVTLPIVEFSTIDGAAVNIVDLAEIHRVTASLLGTAPAATPKPAPTSAPGEPGAPAADGSAPAPNSSPTAPTAAPAKTPASGPTSYGSWDEPIRPGTRPCVN
ncbi:LCP family protein [Leucobacter iarius]|uniref:Cell envelope-related transcriptional attenuator domain-containing protein n=1 Tax=Leucobacter iarius TaxID=333963 RepID=A0ABP4XFD1_9MICO